MQLANPHGTRVRTRLTHRQYVRYLLHIRQDCSPTIFYGQRLFQQLIVDLWATCDQMQLDWLRHHQSKIRAEVYNGVVDAMINDDVDLTAIGQRMILPSSYTGGARFMQQLFQNSMAIVRHFGRPSLFVTFTANPRWEEITRELLPHQNPLDRPDLIARVFYLKQRHLLHLIKRKQIFGQCLGKVWTIEYQKRGLPHMHLLLFLAHDERFMNASQIDQIVCAELPDPRWDPDGVLFEIIKSNMIHGPCTPQFPRAPCLQASHAHDAKTCSKRFPRPFTSETLVLDDGYPQYRRRDDGRSFPLPQSSTSHDPPFMIDNRWVVPYNPYLSKVFKAHINVEICASVQAVKYIHKYIYKGSDRTTLQVQANQDEIARYLQGRYVGAMEAIWRLMEFNVHGEQPPVISLDVHLPGHQMIYFNADAAVDTVDAQLRRSETTLTAFFAYNDQYADGRSYLYQEFPPHFVYSKRERKWAPRKKDCAIGRMYHCSPIAGERFYLRLLLTVVRGPRSFEDLRTVRRHCYATFKEACQAQGLLDDDREWTDCFTEAKTFSSGHALRTLFVTALLYGNVTTPHTLWDHFKEHLCDDLARQLERTQPEIILDDHTHLDYGLFLLQRILKDHGQSLEAFQLPLPVGQWHLSEENPLITRERCADPQREAQRATEMINQLNAGQRECFERITRAIDTAPATAHFFLQGPAGTGKTFVYRCLCSHYRSQGKIVLCVASSGIAALLLPNGQTSHSRFKIPIEINEHSSCNISKRSQLAHLLQRADLLIWDEVPMQHRFCFEAVHRTLCDLRSDDDHLFGGLPVILGGDFAQILPVVIRGQRSQIVQACLQRSHLWRSLHVLFLRENMRLRPDANNVAFAAWIRSLSSDPAMQSHIHFPPYLTTFAALNEFVAHVYPPSLLQSASVHHDLLQDRAILAMRNDTVDDLNAQMIDLLPSEMREYASTDKADANENDHSSLHELPAEYLQSINLSVLPPAFLRLKIGAPIMLLRNLYIDQGLCNGTRLIVTHLGTRCLEAKFLGGDRHGELCLLPRIELTTNEGQLPFILRRKQFPVRLCFAMTINKAQGQLLKTVGIDLRAQAFCHGQLYVALSRCTDVACLCILHTMAQGRTAENIVYPEVLLR